MCIPGLTLLADMPLQSAAMAAAAVGAASVVTRQFRGVINGTDDRLERGIAASRALARIAREARSERTPPAP